MDRYTRRHQEHNKLRQSEKCFFFPLMIICLYFIIVFICILHSRMDCIFFFFFTIVAFLVPLSIVQSIMKINTTAEMCYNMMF